jgi:N6-L-threonylcarbamoyladenine synthase
MNILGIETSCDETAAAIVKNGQIVLSNVVATSLKEHQKYGGIIPEIASRRQLESINAVVQTACEKAKVRLSRIQAIAVTKSPGLIGSLLVGLSYARALSFALKKPLIELDHVKAHLYSAFLKIEPSTQKFKLPKLPALGLIVSGGHTSLYLIKDFKKLRLLGQTRDDAAGEAFDKVARILELGYPGGPAIEQASKKVKGTTIHFSCAPLPATNDFSFSGIKTAVLYFTQKYSPLTKQIKAEVAWAFQNSVVEVIANKSIAACLKSKVKTILVGGGVAANSNLREELIEKATASNIEVFFPPLSLCVDNAAMVAGLAFHEFKSKGLQKIC